MTAERDRPVAIGTVIRNAVAFNLKNWRGAEVNADSLPRTVVELLDLFREREIAFVLVGGLALLQYVAGRNTEDIDVIMAASALDRLPEIQIDDQKEDFARGRFRDLQIDILLTKNRLFDRAQRQHSSVQQFEEQAIRSATSGHRLVVTGVPATH